MLLLAVVSIHITAIGPATAVICCFCCAATVVVVVDDVVVVCHCGAAGCC